MTIALLIGTVLAIYVLYRTLKKDSRKNKNSSSIQETERKNDITNRPNQPINVKRDELVEMIDSLIEQYEEEIREMTPAAQKTKRISWEQIEEKQQMTQIDFSEEIIDRFWGYKKGTTPEIPNSKKLRLGRGVWFTIREWEGG